MYRFRSTRFYIGLEINSKGVRVVQVRRYKRFTMVERAVNVAFKEPIFMDGKIHYWENLQATLAYAVQKSGIQGEVAISLPLHLVRMQHLILPIGLSPTEIEMEIQRTLKDELNTSKEKIYIDYLATPTRDKRYYDILFVAAKRDYLVQLINCLQTVGLKVTAADVDVYALRRALEYIAVQSETGWSKRAVVVAQENRISFLFFDQQSLCSQYHIEAWLETMSQSEKERTILQAATVLRKRVIDQLIICGEQVEFKDMIKAIQASYPCQLHFLSSFEHLDVHERALSSGILAQPQDFLVACGLALREVGS